MKPLMFLGHLDSRFEVTLIHLAMKEYCITFRGKSTKVLTLILDSRLISLCDYIKHCQKDNVKVSANTCYGRLFS